MVTRPALHVIGRGPVDPSSAVLRANDLGVLRGDGIFETVRICAGRPVLLDEHLERMARGALRLALTLPTPAEWTSAVAAVVHASGAGDGVLKLVCTRGPEDGEPTAYVLVTPLPAVTVRGREEGVHAVTLAFGVAALARAVAPWLLGGVKTTSYAVNMAALREAQARGFDDAIWVAPDGTVLEAPTANVAWVRGGVVVTPPAEELGVLRGTTLEALIERAGLAGIEVETRAAPLDELLAANEVMLTSSVRGVAPVLSVDRVPVGSGAVGPVTAALRAAYEELCSAGP